MLVVNTPKRLPNSVFPPSAVNASPLNYSSDRKKTFETVEFLVIRSMACLVSQVMSLKVQFVRLLLVESHSQLKFAFKLSVSSRKIWAKCVSDLHRKKIFVPFTKRMVGWRKPCLTVR